MEAEGTVPPLTSEPHFAPSLSDLGSSWTADTSLELLEDFKVCAVSLIAGLLSPKTVFLLPLAILLGVETRGDSDDQSTLELRRDTLKVSLDLYVLLAKRGGTLGWPISLDPALDVGLFAKEWEAILKL